MIQPLLPANRSEEQAQAEEPASDLRPPGLITYDGLPISSGGAHRIRGDDKRETWHRLSACLQSHTTFQVPSAVRLLLYEGKGTDASFFKRAHKATKLVFGASDKRSRSSDFDEHVWSLSAGDVEKAIDHCDTLRPFPKHDLGGPLVLAIQSEFALLDISTGAILPNQGTSVYGSQLVARYGIELGMSGIYVRLGSRMSCAIYLSFPFADLDIEMVGLAKELDRCLPFRLSTKHWMQWRLNRAGTSYYPRRVKVL